MSSAKRYLVGSLLVATMIGLSGASWAGGIEQSFSKQQLKQQLKQELQQQVKSSAATQLVMQDLAVELTQQVNLQQQQQMSKLKFELQAVVDQSLTVQSSQMTLVAGDSVAE